MSTKRTKKNPKLSAVELKIVQDSTAVFNQMQNLIGQERTKIGILYAIDDRYGTNVVGGGTTITQDGELVPAEEVESDD